MSSATIFVGCFKGRFLYFRMYHNLANLFYKLSESTFYKEMTKFLQKVKVKSIRLAVILRIS